MNRQAAPQALEMTAENKLDLPVQGMTCASCVRRVERALSALPGVHEASVNFATGRAAVRHDPALASRERLVRAIEEAGYSVPGEGTEQAAPDEPTPEEQTLELDVRGMTCAACVRRIEKALSDVPGVRSARVNLVTKRASVAYEPARTSPRALAQTVVDSGYEVANFDALSRAAGSKRRVDAGERARAIEAAELAEQRSIRRDFIVAASLTLPAFVLAMSHGSVAAFEQPWSRWLQFALVTPVVFGPGRRFLRLAWLALKHRTSDMNTLVSLGVLAAWGYSTVALLAPGLFPHAAHGEKPHVYFEAASAILMFVLLGKLLETRARKRLSDAVRGLVALVPKSARRLRDGQHEQVAIEALAVGDVVLVRPGERVPMDGVVLEGESAVDESMLTGESLPVDKVAGDALFAGTLNQSGAVTFRVSKTQEESALAGIVEAVEQAQGSRAPIARLADVVSGYFVPVVLTVAVATLVTWLAIDFSSDGVAMAIERFVAVLVIACPCALGLATPAAVAVGTGRGAELGVLVKGGGPLEAASRIDTVLFDKTGTLTRGKPTLTDVLGVGSFDETELLGWIASVESASEHPVAQAIVDGARARGAELHEVGRFRAVVGYGVDGHVAGHNLRIGTSAWLAQAGIASDTLEHRADELAGRGRTPSFVAVDGALAGLVAVADAVTSEAKQVVRTLRDMGIDVAMVTGDRKRTAEAIAAELGITRVYAEVRPEGKAEIVARERAAGRVVAMVGDGINDAPALAGADVGIAVGSGTDIAIAAADVALLRRGIAALPTALALSRRTLRTIRENLFWAFVYNVIGIPIAAGVFYSSLGFQLSPVLASLAMSLSSVSVLMNSLRLRRFGRGGETLAAPMDDAAEPGKVYA